MNAMRNADRLDRNAGQRAGGIVERLNLWLERYQHRQALAGLDPHLLADLGLDPLEAAHEVRKPFWRA